MCGRQATGAPAAAKPDSAKQAEQDAAVVQMAGPSGSGAGGLVSQAQAAPQPRRPAAGCARSPQGLI